jgi:hypothetical protein
MNGKKGFAKKMLHSQSHSSLHMRKMFDNYTPALTIPNDSKVWLTFQNRRCRGRFSTRAKWNSRHRMLPLWNQSSLVRLRATFQSDSLLPCLWQCERWRSRVKFWKPLRRLVTDFFAVFSPFSQYDELPAILPFVSHVFQISGDHYIARSVLHIELGSPKTSVLIVR